MPIQIANPKVIEKIERLAAATGLGKTAAVEQAVDAMLADRNKGQGDSGPDRSHPRSPGCV
jgi:antitoxin VapB